MSPKKFILRFAPHLPLPYLAVFFSHLIWGGNFFVAKVTLQEIPPNSLAFLRFAAAILLLLPFFLLEKKKTKIKIADLPKLLAIGATMVSLNIALFYQGLLRTTTIDAATLTMIIPILSVIIGWVFLREKIYTVNLLGITSGFIGTVIIIGLPVMLLGLTDPTVITGNILIILASISWVIGGAFSRQMLLKYSSIVITFVAFWVGLVSFSVPFGVEYLKNPQWFSQVTLLGLLGLAYITVLSSISAYFLFEWGLSKMTLNHANLFQYIEPLVAATLGIAILGEKLSFPFMIGVILIVLGVYWGTFAKEPHHHIHRAHRT